MHNRLPGLFALLMCRVTFILTICLILVGCTTFHELEWNEEDNYRWAELSPGYFGSTGFSSLAPSETNIDFQNRLTDEEMAENRHYLNGSGVAAGDIDGDGLTDLYFACLNGPNRLYRNLGGMEFEDISEKAGVTHEEYYSTGAVFADVNGDGHQDLLITAMHRQNALYMNDGAGNFEFNEKSGLGASKGSTTMALADIDGDRDLDLYVTNYKEKSVKDIYSAEELGWENILKEPFNPQQPTGPFTLVPPFDEHYRLFMIGDTLAGAAEAGEEDELYLNNGGAFDKVSDTRPHFLNEQGEPYGLQPDWGLTAKFQDLNSDGLPDLYVANDFFPQDRVWINQGEGTFRAIEWSAIRNMSFAAMAVDFSDINLDGELDIFVTEMLSPEHDRRLRQMGADDPTPNRTDLIRARPQYNRNSMYLKREDDTYAEVAYLSGTEATGWSWATRFMDIDLDGWEDLIVATGFSYDILDIDTQIGMINQGLNMDEHYGELLSRAPELKVPNRMLMNNGDLTFSDRSREWGFQEEDVTHGLATADLDNDGDLDFAVNRLNETALIYENTTDAPRILVKLKGENPNTSGIGAKIRLSGGSHPQEHEISSGGDYLSGSVPAAMFAANEEGANYSLEVTWPDGSTSSVRDVQPNRIYEIYESGTTSVEDETSTKAEQGDQEAIFQDVSNRLDHTHHEGNFDDWGLQPLLPARLSQLGPGTSWIDLDRDGDDDLLIASGRGGTTGAFENLGDGTFRPINSPPFNQTVSGDQTTILGWSTERGANLLIGSSNYEKGTPRSPSVYQYRFDGLKIVQENALSNYSISGPLAAADYDSDGDLDLFLGGRFIPAHYPRNATSRLFKNDGENFVIDEVNSRKLSEIGLVTGAVFSDYDRDGDQDLLLSREWDSIILMENNDGILNDVSDEVGLTDHKGWWNGIATGDFNSDGRPDIVVTNRGTNSAYRQVQDKPLRMYYDDFNRDQRVDIIEAFANEEGNYVPRHQLNRYRQLPVISNRVGSYEQFGDATLEGILGNQLSNVSFKEINTLRHTLFLNRDSGFEPHPLPVEAQFSAAYYAGVADFNNDGNEDLFLSQNFFGFPRQVPRQDAGRGLWLEGDGEGGLSTVPGSKSGIKVYGEQRGAALADFNRDGKVDLSVSQNNAETRLFVNRTGAEGYRIKLDGPSQNSDGIGSGVRLIYDNGEEGPLREIQSGSGYWSQNSFTQVLGADPQKTVTAIEIAWFDGTKQTVKVTDGKREYMISYSEND